MININNPLLSNVRGQFAGLLVFRHVNGQTIISKMPRKRDRSLETDAQRATYERMRTASRYASEMLQDPEKANQYRIIAKQRKLPNAYTAAVTEFLRSERSIMNTHL